MTDRILEKISQNSEFDAQGTNSTTKNTSNSNTSGTESSRISGYPTPLYSHPSLGSGSYARNSLMSLHQNSSSGSASSSAGSAASTTTAASAPSSTFLTASQYSGFVTPPAPNLGGIRQNQVEASETQSSGSVNYLSAALNSNTSEATGHGLQSSNPAANLSSILADTTGTNSGSLHHHPHPQQALPSSGYYSASHSDQNSGPGNGSGGMNPSTGSPTTAFSFVPLPASTTASTHKRPRRKFEEIERIYHCNYPGCTKAYGTLNHLNAHVTMQKHGERRTPDEFKETRRQWKLKKKFEMEKYRQERLMMEQQQQQHQQHQHQAGIHVDHLVGDGQYRYSAQAPNASALPYSAYGMYGTPSSTNQNQLSPFYPGSGGAAANPGPSGTYGGPAGVLYNGTAGNGPNNVQASMPMYSVAGNSLPSPYSGLNNSHGSYVSHNNAALASQGQNPNGTTPVLPHIHGYGYGQNPGSNFGQGDGSQTSYGYNGSNYEQYYKKEG